MGIPVGDNPADPDTLKQLEKLDELEDEMGEVYMEGNQQLKSVTRRWQPLHVFIYHIIRDIVSSFIHTGDTRFRF